MLFRNPGKPERYNVGSPLYMPPESLSQNIYSVKSDIWALGIMLFEMLCGRTPWECRTEKELLEKISRIPADIPSEFSVDIKEFL
jgi:serine/threonine protein kinase